MVERLTALITKDKPTALANVVGTMEQLVNSFYYEPITVQEKLAEALDELKNGCAQRLPQAVYLEEIREVGLTPSQFQALIVNTIVRVTPTYFEIPANLASAGLHGNLKSYGTIANNVYDEAGHGVPSATHPALLNTTAAVMSEVFNVRPISFKTTLAALTLRAKESLWKSEDDGVIDYARAEGLVRRHLEVDEFNQSRTDKALQEQLDVAIEYAPMIPQSSLHFHQERVRNLTEAIGVQGNLLVHPEAAHQGDLSLAAQLAVREAAASDPEGFIEVFSREVVGRYMGHAPNLNNIMKSRWWGDIHVDPEFGKMYGYEGHSSEDDHSEQALVALVERLRDSGDLLYAMRSMNQLNALLLNLWEGTVVEMKHWADPLKILPPKPLSQSQIAEAKRTMLSGYS